MSSPSVGGALYLDDPTPPVGMVSRRPSAESWDFDPEEGAFVRELFHRAALGDEALGTFLRRLQVSPMESARAVAAAWEVAGDSLLRHEAYAGYTLRRLPRETYVDFDRFTEHATFRLDRAGGDALVTPEAFVEAVALDTEGGRRRARDMGVFGAHLACRYCRKTLVAGARADYAHDDCGLCNIEGWSRGLVDNCLVRVFVEYYLEGTVADRVRTAWRKGEAFLALHAQRGLRQIEEMKRRLTGGDPALRRLEGAREALSTFLEVRPRKRNEAWQADQRKRFVEAARRRDDAGLRAVAARLGFVCGVEANASSVAFETVCDLAPDHGGVLEGAGDE